MGIRTNWKVYRLTLTNANQQYSQALTTRVKSITVRCTSRTIGFKISLIADEITSGTQYLTIYPSGTWMASEEIIGQKTIYVSSETAGAVIEIEEWS